MILVSDIGLILDVIGVFLVMFTVGRLPTGTTLLSVGQYSKKSLFHKFCERVIPTMYVEQTFLIGVAFLVLGILFQTSWFDYEIEFEILRNIVEE